MKRTVEDKVLKYITDYASKSRPATRKQLVAYTGTSDRHVRLAIEALRNQGHRICSNSADGKGGYWIAEGLEDYRRFRSEYLSRAKKQIDTVKAMDAATDGQMGMVLDAYL